MSIGDWVVIIALVLLILYLFYKYIEASSPELCEVCGKKSTGTYYDGYVVEMHLCDCDAEKAKANRPTNPPPVDVPGQRGKYIVHVKLNGEIRTLNSIADEVLKEWKKK
jgi:hypothetical protein